MRTSPTSLGCAALATCLAFAACASDDAAIDEAARGEVAIAVAPLSLSDVGDAVYTVTVDNGAEPAENVFTVTVSSSQYGDGEGALTYVGPCDASANPNTVTLTLLELHDTSGAIIDPSRWRVPPPVSREVTCEANADVEVRFDLTVMRMAEQGFFDVAVEFSDVFCSAKLDCLDDDGDPIELLHNDGTRDTTVVLAWACASGEGTATWLHMEPVVVACNDGTQLTVAPGAATGNQGGLPPYFFQTAVYRGREDVPDVDKCYWNTAVGVDLAMLPAGLECTMTAAATASDALWDGGSSPAGHVYPYLQWEVDIVTDGALACGHHAVNAPDSGVTTEYTSGEAGRHFAHTMACADAPEVTSNSVVCSSSVGDGGAVEFVGLGGDAVGVVVGDQASQPMRLPAGHALADSCCQDHCCAP